MRNFLFEWTMGSVGFQSSDELYLPGTTLRFQLQAQGSSTFEPLAATVFSDALPTILKLADRRLGYRINKEQLDTVPWTSSIDDHLRHAVHDIQAGAIPDWFEVINDFDNWPDTELWENWIISPVSLGSFVFASPLSLFTLPHPITAIVQGLVLEFIPGVRWRSFNRVSTSQKKKPTGFPATNIVLREEDGSPVIIDFGDAWN
ncbi:hypothetical protein EV421DRAFT_1915121 [Armillaria borealis]|uniref:Uncharacterized protein n=1 Tax=Armillaria borealis TaxID=47425 RepID=A0AA39IEX6_9AGAR|nr:hypothetical protein EV421DRAFT_1915121 [Armillaria borealis]